MIHVHIVIHFMEFLMELVFFARIRIVGNVREIIRNVLHVIHYMELILYGNAHFVT